MIKYIRIFTILLLSISLMMNLYMMRKMRTIEAKYIDLENTHYVALQQIELKNKALDVSESHLLALRQVGNKAYALQHPNNSVNNAIIHYNQQINSLYIDANNLPVPPTDKQYQVWAQTATGEYISLGVFNYQTDMDNFYALKAKKLNSVEPKHFLVSLEPPQGSQQPNLSKLVATNNK